MSQLSRQELYDKIKETSKDAYILSEMKRLGYWKEGDKPSVAANLIKRKTELQVEINKLSRQIKNPEEALKAIHKQRMAAARQRRVDTKVKAEIKRYQRATAWYQKKLNSIDYLGNACVLSHKNKQAIDLEKLKINQLPKCETAISLAKAMGITLSELRFLCYTNEVSKITHYQRFGIHKKTGGVRLISAPMPRLKRLQYWVLDNILYQIPLSEQAHGFVPSKSIVTNALPHIQQKVVLNLDLKNFFPTIAYPRIKGLFAGQGYGSEVATLLALICSEPDTQTVEMDGQRYYIHSKQRFLPQGAPTSPMISNIICRRLDARLQGLANKYGFVYTRYADDMTFSSQQSDKVHALLNWIKATVKEEGFVLHPDKTRIMHQGARQEVTGIVVNQQLSVNRKLLKQFRALLFQIKKDGYEGKSWGKGGSLLPTIKGFAHYVKMVNAPKGERFLAQINEIIALHGYPDDQTTFPRSNNNFRKASALGELPLSSLRVAEPPSRPELDKIIQHHDVLEQVRAALSLENKQSTSKVSTVDESQAGIFTFIKSLLGGKS